MLFAPGHVLSLLTLGCACGMVVDVGYTETLVIPVSFERSSGATIKCTLLLHA